MTASPEDVREAVERLNAWAAIEAWEPGPGGVLVAEPGVLNGLSYDLRIALAELSRLSRLVGEAGEALELVDQIACDLEDCLDLIEDEDRREYVEILFGGMKASETTLSELRRAAQAHKAIKGGGE